MSGHFHLTEEERAHRLPSGVKFTFNDRVSWASTYMKKAGLLASPKRGDYQITDRGLQVLKGTAIKDHRQVLGAVP